MKKLTATTFLDRDPLITDNISAEYALGQRWYNTTSGQEFYHKTDGVWQSYLTSLSGAVLTDQTTPQTIGATGTRMTKIWVTDITCTNAIAASITGTAAKATNLVGGNNTTLLGSIPYQSNTDTTTLLTPNTTTIKKFLSQTGTGTNGVAPTWTTIAVSDLTYLLNDEWLKTYDFAGNVANLIKLSKDNITEFANPVGIDSFYHVLNSGFNDIVNIPVDASSPDNTQHGIGITIGGQRLFSVSALATATTALVDTYLINTAATISSSVINPLLTIAESWIGPSSTTGVYFKSGNVGIGTTDTYGMKLAVRGSGSFMSSTFDNNTNGGTISIFQDNANYGTIWSQKNGNQAWGNLALAPNGGNVGIGTTDLDGTPAIGRLTVKGSTNDGTTNIFVGRDSDEVNVFSVDTDGAVTASRYVGLIEALPFEFRDLTPGTSQTYELDLYAFYGYTVEGIVLEVDTGTLTDVHIKINSTDITSLTTLTVDTTRDYTTATGANTVVATDKVVLVTNTSYTGVPTILRGSLKIKRT